MNRRSEKVTKREYRRRWDKDIRTGQPCPKCGAEIVYNGNYFCSEFVIPALDGDGSPATCDWAMPENERGNLFKNCLAGLTKNREESEYRRA